MDPSKDGKQSPSRPLTRLRIGSIIGGRWVIDRELGKEGMGWVLGAHHATIGKRVAIKIMRAGPFRQRAAQRRFIGEAEAASAVNHPNVVQIFDLGFLVDGRPFYVMEMLAGITLAQLMRRQQLSFDHICELAMQVAYGLEAIHGAGLVHRDLTPSNLMVALEAGPPGRCKIFDFGIAKPRARRSQRFTPPGEVMGTPTYMAPEQCLDQPTDTRADIYAFGVLLHTMATGELPFGHQERDHGRIMFSQVRDRVARITRLACGEMCPPAFASLVARCLAKRPSDRIQRIETVRDELFGLQLLARLTRSPPGVDTPTPQIAYQAQSSIQTGGSNRLGDRLESLHCAGSSPDPQLPH